MACITLFVIFFLICCPAYAEKIITTDSGYKIYQPDYNQLMEGVSPFCLGGVSDVSLLFEYGVFLSIRAKSLNTNACVIGYSDILNPKQMTSGGRYEDNIAPFFSYSPYQSAQTAEAISKGLLAGGIFPVLNAKYGIDDAYIENLKHRNCFPAIFTDDTEYSEYQLINLELPIVDDFRNIVYKENLLKSINWQWHGETKQEETLREDILLNSIVLLKGLTTIDAYKLFYTKIDQYLKNESAVFVSDPRLIDLSKFKSGYLIHSDDDLVLEKIRLICKGIYFARGKKNWPSE